MASNIEIDSLEDIPYGSKRRTFVYFFLSLVVFFVGFVSFFPLNPMIKTLTHKLLKDSHCKPDWTSLEFEWILPKIVFSDIHLPASCFNHQSISLKHLTLNFQLISFSPFGIPIRLDTEFNGQPISVYFVQGIGKRFFRVKDQNLSLFKISPLLGDDFKLGGNLKVDLSLLISNLNLIKEIDFKAESKNLEIPAQNISGFSIPPVKLDHLFTEMNLDTPPRLKIEKFLLGDVESSVRANFSGSIDLSQINIEHSPLNLSGELSFSDDFKQNVPVDLILQSYPQKDGFYQIRLGGTLSSPKPTNP